VPVQENIGGNTTEQLPCVVPPVVADGGIVPVWFTGWALDGCTTIDKIIPLFVHFFTKQVKEIKKKKIGKFQFTYIYRLIQFILDRCLQPSFWELLTRTASKLSRPDISQKKSIQLCILLFNFIEPTQTFEGQKSVTNK